MPHKTLQHTGMAYSVKQLATECTTGAQFPAGAVIYFSRPSHLIVKRPVREDGYSFPTRANRQPCHHYYANIYDPLKDVMVAISQEMVSSQC